MALNGQHLGTGDHLETRPLFSPPPKKHVQQKNRWKHTSQKHNQKCAEICSGEFGLGGFLKLDWNLWLEKRQT